MIRDERDDVTIVTRQTKAPSLPRAGERFCRHGVDGVIRGGRQNECAARKRVTSLLTCPRIGERWHGER